MKIAAWNVERLKHKKDLNAILSECGRISADILVLTETDERVTPEYKNCFRTPLLKGISTPSVYADTENRVSVFTNYECVGRLPTYDEKTAVCAVLRTEKGDLLVYGTIMGINGNRRTSYREDLVRQLEDINRYVKEGYNICVAGDFNCSFGDNYYFTNYGRDQMLKVFSDHNIDILTKDRPECIDHIAISNTFIGNAGFCIEEWNYDKSLSDHKGIAVTIQ
ncbi:MAG: endonuclease/exonuclease/phosphatase family protein [Oscillospiraceae bacterium]|nr:endonuclease/exonuclease/phosphatase family protein [Oscillospiraceae bacterium]